MKSIIIMYIYSKSEKMSDKFHWQMDILLFKKAEISRNLVCHMIPNMLSLS